MKSKFIIITLLVGLLSQQVMAGAVTASMMGSARSETPSMEMSSTSHQHHEMTSEARMIDCCQSDCAYCIAGCYSVLNSQMLNKLSEFTLVPIQQSNYEPLAQAFDSLFRPPIFA